MTETNSKTIALGENNNFELPRQIRLLISIPVAIIVLGVLTVYVFSILGSLRSIDPQKYGLPVLLVASIIILVVINIPWNTLGFRIKKIGTIELERVIDKQGENNFNELADLQSQIDDLKQKLAASDGKENMYPEVNKLDELILRFLKQYNQWAFSALRIKNWGSTQPGFADFKNYETQDIRESLRRLLAKRQLVLKMSKKGNPIFRIK